MAAHPVPTVFISHAHADKPVARRILRRLTAHGAKGWLDERELRVGAALAPSIRGHIERAGVVLVVASHAAAQSDWVRQELGFAREHGKSIVPVFIDPLARHEMFKDDLGVDATYRPAFAGVLEAMTLGLFQSWGIDAPKPSEASLEAGLRDLVREEPDLGPLIQACLDGVGTHATQDDTVFGAAFHPLDEALNTLFELRPAALVANHAARGFARQGAGMRALSLWIAASGDGELPLVSAVGGERLRPELLPAAIALLGACDPPNNHALYNFIAQNADALDAARRRDVVRLVTWPTRTDTSRLADVLGWVALKAFPEVLEIQRLWTEWIYGGSFDGKPSSPDDLARYLADAAKEGLPGFDDVNKALRNHVRGLLRSRQKDKVARGIDHLQAAADRGAPILATLLTEAEGAVASAEWKDWDKADPETAEWMKTWVYNTVQQARGERDWLKAFKDVDKFVDFQRHRRRLLEEEGN